MDTAHIITFIVVLLLAATISRPLARWAHLPYSAMLVIVGYVGSEIFVLAGIDTGLRWTLFRELVFFVLLPVLIFESAMHFDARLLLKNLAPILFLAIPMMLLSAGLTAVLLYYGIGHATGFPWLAALIAGAVLGATDPAAVLAIFKHLNAPPRLTALLDGESLFNDATAIMLFSLLLVLATGAGTEVSLSAATLQFIKIFIGGLVIGLAVGGLLVWLLNQSNHDLSSTCLTLAAAYGSFLLAEEWLHVSGVMAVLVTGLMVSACCHHDKRPDDGPSLDRVWAFLAHVANAMIFLLVGITITWAMFEHQWLAMLIGVVAVLVARAIGVFVALPMFTTLPRMEPVSVRYQTVMAWGGIRGAVALALALSLPLELEYWWTIQSITYGVVLFTLFVQAPTMPWLMRRLKITAQD